MKRAWMAALAIAVVGCSGSDDNPTTGPGSGSGGSGGGSVTGTGGAGGTAPEHSWTECQASDQAWVRRAISAIEGRRPWGQAEVNAYTDVLAGVRKVDGPKSPGAPDAGDLENAKKTVALAMMHDGAFLTRWSDFLMDALQIVRVEDKSQEGCYDAPSAMAFDDGSLAAFVRDNDPATAIKPPVPAFSAGQLMSSALVLDDVSVVYRAHLVPLVWLPLNGANVDDVAMERIRRQDFGAVFDSAYIHRDLVCLGCHNSEFSVTFDPDPSKNRAWPVPGLFELSIYGASDGKHDPAEAATKGTDELRAISMLKYAGVADGTGTQAVTPWSWYGNGCGFITKPPPGDPLLGVDTFFGSVRGTDATVLDLERSLHRGVDRLAAHGLVRVEGGKLADDDEAFAYLVAENIVEKVWAEAMGTRLTIANYFARTEVQRDILMSLTEHFVASHFSLKTLLFDILANPAFNMKTPDEGCGQAAYEMPNILDPWTTSDADLGRRGNSPADGVFPISSRPLVRSLHTAMIWPPIADYPHSQTEEDFQTALGYFVKDAVPGFRGLDFQGRLSWEARYGACAPQAASDVITEIASVAAMTPGATVGDGVIALKDRLIGEPSIEATKEKPAIEALIQAQLASTDVSSLDAKLRLVCGVLIASPQFLLGGVPPKDASLVPKLAPLEASYATACAYLAGELAPAYKVTCGSQASVAKP